jgi:hypothetical protein
MTCGRFRLRSSDHLSHPMGCDPFLRRPRMQADVVAHATSCEGKDEARLLAAPIATPTRQQQLAISVRTNGPTRMRPREAPG